LREDDEKKGKKMNREDEANKRGEKIKKFKSEKQ
jgi:hypothetical protein